MKAKGYTRETILSIGIKDRGFDTFKVGDTVEVAQRVVEGDKTRLQYFEGDVISIRKAGVATTFTVRRIGAHSVAVEKVFAYYSPRVEAIKYVRSGDIRRAKLYYLRDRVGKAARVREKVLTKEQKEHAA